MLKLSNLGKLLVPIPNYYGKTIKEFISVNGSSAHSSINVTLMCPGCIVRDATFNRYLFKVPKTFYLILLIILITNNHINFGWSVISAEHLCRILQVKNMINLK